MLTDATCNGSTSVPRTYRAGPAVITSLTLGRAPIRMILPDITQHTATIVKIGFVPVAQPTTTVCSPDPPIRGPNPTRLQNPFADRFRYTQLGAQGGGGRGLVCIFRALLSRAPSRLSRRGLGCFTFPLWLGLGLGLAFPSVIHRTRHKRAVFLFLLLLLLSFSLCFFEDFFEEWLVVLCDLVGAGLE